MQSIVIFFECLRRDHVHCYGYERETTPVIDSIVLDRRGMMWTECAPAGHRTSLTFEQIAKFVQAVNDAGVHTTFISSNAHPAGKAIVHASTVFRRYLPTESRQDIPERPVSEEMVEDFARTYSDRDNFLAVLHFRESHTPYEPRQYLDEFLGDKTYRRDFERHGSFPPQFIRQLERHNVLLPFNGEGSVRYKGKMRGVAGKRVGFTHAFYAAAYDGAIKLVDSMLTRLLEAFPDAEIFITGDHGEAMGEGGRYYKHTHGAFPELMQVPLVCRTPTPTDYAYRSIEGRCSHMNMMATVASRFGVKVQTEPLPWPTTDELEEDVKRRLAGLGYIDRTDDMGG